MLLQAPGSIPSSFNVYLAGVNATAGAVPAAGACIQHPGGGGKRIAIASGACAPGAFAPAACPYRNAARRAQPWHLGTARPLAAERHAGRSERAPARAGRTSPPALRQSRCRAPMPRSYRPCSSRRAQPTAGSGCNTALGALLLSTANRRLCKTIHGMFTWELLNRRGSRIYLPCCCGRDSSGALPGRSCGAAARPRAWARWARPCLTPHGSRSSACSWPAHRPAPMAAARTTLGASARCAPDRSGRALYFLVFSLLFLGRMHGSLVLVFDELEMHA